MNNSKLAKLLLFGSILFFYSPTIFADADEVLIRQLVDTIHTKFHLENYQDVSEQLDNALKSAFFSEEPKAVKRLRQAIFFTQEKNSLTDNFTLDILYRLQWQLGRVFKSQAQWQKAGYVYQQAQQTLEQLRNIAGIKKPSTNIFKQVYYEHIDILLTRYEHEVSNHILRKIIDIIEVLKQAELENYFQDECLVAENQKRVEDNLKNNTAIFYPILFPIESELPNRSLELLLILPNNEIKWIKPPTQWRSVRVNIAELNSMVKRFRAELETPKREVPPGKTIRQYGKEIYEILIKPLENYLDNIEILVSVPDGILRTIPLIALFDGKKFVVEKPYSIVTIPGLTLTRTVYKPFREEARILLGGMSEKVCISKKSCFESLSKTKQTLENIQALYPNRSKIIQDQDFLISRLRYEMHSTQPYTIMHLHTHATFSKERQNTFLLTYDTKLDKNNRLTMDNLERLFLTGERRQVPIELLTLGACETAKGDEQAALGLAGVAFKSGARSVLASLWPVDELTTAELMKRFYAVLQTGTTTKVQALQQVQRELLRLKANDDYTKLVCRHGEDAKKVCKDGKSSMLPTYWAPFILIGNWL